MLLLIPLFEVILFKAVTSVHTIPEAPRTALSREYKEKNSVSPIWGMSILFKAVMLSTPGARTSLSVNLFLSPLVS